MTRTVTLTVTFTIDTTAEHLHSDQAIRDEITSWLQSLKAEVITVEIHGEECDVEDE